MEQDKIEALASIRNQLGNKITTGAEWIRVQESREEWQEEGQGQLKLIAPAETPQDLGSESLLKREDFCLGKGIPRGQLTEIIEGGAASRGVEQGAGLVLADLLARARLARQYVMLFDVGSGFSVESFPEQDLESLLWVGCASASEAVEALDIASRDENFSLFLLDFRNCEPGEWRSIRPQQWYRVLGQMRQRGSAAVVFSEAPVSAVSKQKWSARMRLSCQDLYRERTYLWQEMQFSPLAEAEPQERRKVDYRQKVG